MSPVVVGDEPISAAPMALVALGLFRISFLSGANLQGIEQRKERHRRVHGVS